MRNTISIRPSKELSTNYAKISALAKQNPVVITVNGREDTVILSHEDFLQQQNYISELEARLALYNHLAQAKDDIKLGMIQNLDDAINDVFEELDYPEF